MDSIAGLSGLPDLRRLSLAGRQGIQDFSELHGLPRLEWLFLDSCTGLSDGNALASLRGLSLLSINNCVGLSDFGWLRQLVNLHSLSLNGCRGSSLDFCQGLPQLRTIRAKFVEGVDKASALRECSNLRRLELSLRRGRASPINVPLVGRLRSLTLDGNVTVDDLLSVSQCSSLSELTAFAVDGLSDLTPISALKKLRKLHLVNCRDLVSSAGLASMPELEVLDLRGSSIRYLDIPHACRSISEINLDRCLLLSGAQELVSLPSLRRLVLPPIDETVLDELRRLAKEIGNRNLYIESDPVPGGYETG